MSASTVEKQSEFISRKFMKKNYPGGIIINFYFKFPLFLPSNEKK